MQHSRYQMVEALLLKHEMHVARPPAMPSQLRQQFTYRPVVRNRIRHGHDSMEPEHALLIAVYDRATICFASSIVVLYVVLAMAVRLPNVDLDAFNGRARRGFDRAEHQQRVAVGVGGDGEAVGVGGSVVRVEGA